MRAYGNDENLALGKGILRIRLEQIGRKIRTFLQMTEVRKQKNTRNQIIIADLRPLISDLCPLKKWDLIMKKGSTFNGPALFGLCYRYEDAAQ
jgi:hypothetical protein